MLSGCVNINETEIKVTRFKHIWFSIRRQERKREGKGEGRKEGFGYAKRRL